MHRTIYYCHIKNIAVEVIIRLIYLYDKWIIRKEKRKKKEYSGDIYFQNFDNTGSFVIDKFRRF